MRRIDRESAIYKCKKVQEREHKERRNLAAKDTWEISTVIEGGELRKGCFSSVFELLQLWYSIQGSADKLAITVSVDGPSSLFLHRDMAKVFSPVKSAPTIKQVQGENHD